MTILQRALLITMVLALPYKLLAQSDTMYFDNAWNAATEDTLYTCACKQDGTGAYDAKCYSRKTGKLAVTVHTTTVDSMMKDADFVNYYESGYKWSEGSYRNGKPSGKWTSYYDSSAIIWYVHDCNGDTLRSYYRSGKLKRQQHADPADTTKYVGKCYNEAGKEIPFTTFETMPKCPYNMGHYLSKNIKYPKDAREHGIEGRVIVRFVVKADGRIADATVVKHVSPDLDDESLRVVSAMKKWKPGIQDDKAVDVYFTLPITYRLE